MPSTALEILIKASDQCSGTLKNIGKESGGLGDKLKFLAVAAAGAVTALVSIKTLQSVIGTTQDLGAAVNKLKRETGETSEEASKLLYAFKRTGLSGDEASASLGILAKKLKGVSDEETGVATGGKTTADILNDIGVKAFTTSGQVGSLADIMPQIADVFKRMPDGIEKTGLAMQLFGRSGKDMIPILNQGSEGLKELGADAERFGLVLSDKGVADIKAYTGAQRELGSAFDGIKLAIGLAIMPALTDLTTAFTNALPPIRVFITEGLAKVGDFLTAHEEDIRNFAQGLRDLAEQGFQRVVEIGPSVIGIVQTLATVFQDVAESLVPMLAGALSNVASLLQAHPPLVYAIIGAWAAFQIGQTVQDLIGLAAGFVGVATGAGVATGGVVALRAALVTTGIGALILGLATAAYLVYTNWSWIWPALQNFVIDTYNVTVPYINGLINSIEALSLGLLDLPEAQTKAGVGAEKYRESMAKAGHIIDNLNKSCRETTPALGALWWEMEGKYQPAAEGAAKDTLKLTGDIQTLANNTELAIPPVLDLGAGLVGAGGSAGDAAKKLDDAAKAALEAHKAFVTLIGTTTLYNAMVAEASITEIRLTDTIYGGLGAQAERKNLLEAEIGVLQRELTALTGTGDANDILRDSIQGTIDRLQEQISAIDAAKNKWILFGSEGLGPVSAAIQGINDAISEQTSGLQGLLNVQTQEEADLVARIAYYDAQIAGLNAVTSATQALTQAEQDRLGVAQGRSASGNAEIERIQDQVDIINEMERRRRENGRLTVQEQKALEDALRKLNQMERGGVLTLDNVNERMRERIWDLQQETERSDETVDALNKLADSRTKEGDAAIKALEAERDPLAKKLAAIRAAKEAEEKGLEARAKGFPTMEQWTTFLVGEGIEHGIITQGVLDQIPALHDWAITHAQTVFNIALGLNMLELGQRNFFSDTTTLLGDWTTQWGTAAALVAASMASVNGGTATPAAVVPALQSGGYIRRGGLAFLDAGELVTPARNVRGAGGAGAGSTVTINVGERGIFLGERREVEAMWEKYLRPLVRAEFK